MSGQRLEHDNLGERLLPTSAYFGIHTARALENFGSTGQLVPRELIHAMVRVKQAAAAVNGRLGFLDQERSNAILSACQEILEGRFADQFPLPALQGGAGTSTHMNVNEVIANRGLELLGADRGEYTRLHPNDHVNLFQSTNDVYPTALRIALLTLLQPLEQALAALQDALQQKEKEFATVLKLGRTQLQDAVPLTLGQEFSAWAEAVSRDRWRIYKAGERLRRINLGGTAVGTGTGAPRTYIFHVVEELRRTTGLGLARAENAVDATQNADEYCEVSGFLKSAAVTLLKLSGDLRLLSSGPRGGLGEIELPPVQAGSSLMPGKVNPVLPEFAALAAMQVIANDSAVTSAAAAGQLELNAFLPLIACNLIDACKQLTLAVDRLTTCCIPLIHANQDQCGTHLKHSTALATLLAPYLGYEQASLLAKQALAENRPLRDVVLEQGILTEQELDLICDVREATSAGIPGSNRLAHKLQGPYTHPGEHT